MISFVWLSDYPFLAGTGGSETYTAGHIRELMQRGIPTRLITVGMGKKDGRQDFPDINFYSVPDLDALRELDDTLVFVTYPVPVQTKHQAFAVLHCPLSQCSKQNTFLKSAAQGKRLIAPSKFAAKMWADFFDRKLKEIPVVYPFATNDFGRVERPRAGGKTKVLFAGRLTPDKGVYTLLASLHLSLIDMGKMSFTATTACDHAPEGKIIRQLLKAHPFIDVVPARKGAAAMAELLAEHDIVVIPTTDMFWKEAFGVLSVEAQHAGCRVVAARTGGLPETDCGGLILVEPDNPYALAEGIARAARLGPLRPAQRNAAAKLFGVEPSVDALLQAIGVTAPSAVAVQ